MSRRRLIFWTLALLIAALLILAAAFARVPSRGPLAFAAPAAPAAHWTAQGALITWPADPAANQYTISRCRAHECLLIDLVTDVAYLDTEACNGDSYWVGAFGTTDGSLMLLGWTRSQPLTGGRAWFPVAGTVSDG